jgi:hypothetical protein
MALAVVLASFGPALVAGQPHPPMEIQVCDSGERRPLLKCLSVPAGVPIAVPTTLKISLIRPNFGPTSSELYGRSLSLSVHGLGGTDGGS